MGESFCSFHGQFSKIQSKCFWSMNVSAVKKFGSLELWLINLDFQGKNRANLPGSGLHSALQWHELTFMSAQKSSMVNLSQSSTASPKSNSQMILNIPMSFTFFISFGMESTSFPSVLSELIYHLRKKNVHPKKLCRSIAPKHIPNVYTVINLKVGKVLSLHSYMHQVYSLKSIFL